MKKYKAILFDWDGTAVTSRRAPADEVLKLMEPLLKKGIVMCIISGTSYPNLAGGKLHELLPQEALDNLYLGLDRGASNYGFENNHEVLLENHHPSVEDKLRIDRAAYEVHAALWSKHNYPTDICFTRVNYCKIDLQTQIDRGDALFFHASELDLLNEALKKHGIESLAKALEMSEEIALETGIALKATTDAKFIELGTTTKSDNANFMMDMLEKKYGIHAEDCAFFGDEFNYMDEGVPGSDAFMITPKTRGGDFFDVSPEPLALPEGVVSLKGSVERFAQFLREQNS